MAATLRKKLKLLMTRHSPSGEPNVFIHSMPRSGSTWLMELILTQPGFTSYNEPLNLRKEAVRENLGISEWADLHRSGCKDKIQDYLERLCTGRLRDPKFNKQSPLSPFYRPFTHRTVLKFIHGAEEYINWLSESLNGRVIFLIRHPIPVALSRNNSPKLDTILDSNFSQFFSEPQLALARKTINGDDQFARNVLDWCLRNSVALRSRTDDWVILTYEQLVVDPRPAVDRIVTRLNLPRPDRIIKRLSIPSKSTSLSNPGTQHVLLESRDAKGQQWLVEKWKNDVSKNESAVTSELLYAFGLSDVYKVSDALPETPYWI